MTEFLAECIMILYHEKENGTLTENARNDIAEFLYKACEHLLQGEPELLEEVYEAMEPAIKLNREIIKELQDDKAQLNIQLHSKDRILENGIIKLIQRIKEEGKTISETEQALTDIFLLNKKEAHDKVTLHWEKDNITEPYPFRTACS